MKNVIRIGVILGLMHAGNQAALAQIDQSDMAANLTEALTFNKYPSYQHYDTIMHKFVSDYPEICSIDTFGFSRQGRLLLALKISDNVNEKENEPSFFYTATMHGDELVGYNLLLRLADFLLSEYANGGEVTWLVDQVEIWLNPLANPDLTYYPDTDSTLVNAIRPGSGSHPEDHNRIFPDPSLGEANDTTGKLLEVKYMMQFMMDHRFNMSANIHSGAEVVNYPWDHKAKRHPDDDWYYFISREYADEARSLNASYMNGFADGVTNGWDWYDIYGGRQDYVNHYLQGREVTLELSNAKKLPSEDLVLYWDYNKWALFNMMSQASYGIHGLVRDVKTKKPLAASIIIDEHDDISSFVYSDSLFGKFYRYLKEGSYDLIVSSPGYDIDTVTSVPVYDYHSTRLVVELDSVGRTGIDPVFDGQETSMLLYPNPAVNHLVIEFSDPGNQILELSVLGIDGKEISFITDLAPSAHQRYNVSHLQAGIYILRVQTQQGSYHATFMKQ